MKTALVSLLWILVFSLESPAQFKTYLPQIAIGDATGITWRTGIAVMNTAANGTANASVTVRFTKSDGTAFDVASSFVDENRQPIGASGNTISFQISGRPDPIPDSSQPKHQLSVGSWFCHH